MSRLRAGVCGAFALSVLTNAAAARAQTPDPNTPDVLPAAREMELALSAAPANLRAGAGVYVMTAAGYRLARPSTNKFTCIVNRDHPKAIKPTCFDEEGTATIIPKILRVGELMLQGKPLPEIAADIRAGFQSGKFISPRRPGVAYMLSGDIANVNAQTGQISSFPPHVMFYAPNLTNADIGADGTPGMPFVAYQGPQGYMIMLPDAGAHDHAGAPAAAASPVVDAARAVFPDHHKNIVSAFKAMPAEKYTSKPVPELMSFGEFALHIASANLYYCRRLGATAQPPGWLKPTAPKEQLVKLLDDSFEYCAPVLAQLTDAVLGEKEVTPPNPKVPPGTRAKALMDLIAGMDHHYGQAAAYLRMNGIVPPTATETTK